MANLQAPRDIRRFETVQILSVVLGLIHQFGIPDVSWFDATAGSVVTLTLSLLVSRRRKNWARWMLAVLFGLGVALFAYSVPGITMNGFSAMWALSITATALEAIALALLFTRQSSDWLATPPDMTSTS